jgi:diaminohydroxyphosphoribosylaminopyrimidine deaminase/5-amino-6-(5-phosphoribosylamino)uracil reductase
VARVVGAGIRRVVAATEDPNPAVRGRGFGFLRAHGVEVDVGVGAARAACLNQAFFTLVRENRPFVILKVAASLDGCIAAAPGHRTQLTSAVASRHAQHLRAEVDAIGVGVGTILTDDPLLTPRGVYRARPLLRVVFDRRLRTPPHARLLSTHEAGPVIIMTTAAASAHPAARKALEARGAQIEVARGETLSAALDVLAARQVGSLLLEGGASLHASAWDEQVVDFVRLYVAPSFIGSSGVRFLEGRRFSTTDLIDRRVVPLGHDVLIEGYVHRPH